MKTTKRILPQLGVSSCLLGESVRYDGKHKQAGFLLGSLAPYLEFVSVCPEVELGMGVPREPIRLEHHEDGVHLITVESKKDLSQKMNVYAKNRIDSLKKANLCGYVLKKKSPSCGYFRVSVYDINQKPIENGRGFFAKALREGFPFLPIEEEDFWWDAKRKENFLVRVFCYFRLQTLYEHQFSIGELVEFHSAHKLLLLAHSPEAYKELGPLVAKAKQIPYEKLRDKYRTGFLEALEKTATIGKHMNVLQHMAGYFSKTLDSQSRTVFFQVLEEYQEGVVPLLVPLTLIRYYAKVFQHEYLLKQVYLSPYPIKLHETVSSS